LRVKEKGKDIMSIRDKLRVMVVDDMSTSRGLITQALDALGIRQIATADTGKSALAALSAAPVHLVISDFNMPEMNGLQFLHALRTNAATKGIGFILITGKADADIIEGGKRLGMNNFLKKPFQPADMKACVEAVVGPL
jgi:two-component system chemotaxis response regulator CheY